MKRLYTTAEVSRIVGRSYNAICYGTVKGWIKPSSRTAQGKPLFDEGEIRRYAGLKGLYVSFNT